MSVDSPAPKAKGIGLAAISPIQRQLQDIKRQQARQQDGIGAARLSASGLRRTSLAPAAPAAPPESADAASAAASNAPAAASRPSGPVAPALVAARRLGLPIRGGPEPPSKRIRTAMEVKQEVLLEEEPEGGVRRSVVLQAAKLRPAKPMAESPRQEVVDVDLDVDVVDEADSREVTSPRLQPRLRRALLRPAPAVRGEPAPGRGCWGSLFGHLNSARSRLVSEAVGTTKRGPAVVRPRLLRSGAALRPAGKAKASAKLLLAERRKRETTKARELVEKDMQDLQRRLEGNYANMKNFIRTRAEPTIFYCPAKPSSQTDQLLQETRRAIEQKILSLRIHLRGADEELEVAEAEESGDNEEEDANEKGEAGSQGPAS